MITHTMLNSLTDQECLVFWYILKREKYNQIAYLMRISRVDVCSHMLNVYIKFRVWPRIPATLQLLWKRSLAEEKMQRDLEKEKLRASAELPAI